METAVEAVRKDWQSARNRSEGAVRALLSAEA
jgi:hypothetical protein